MAAFNSELVSGRRGKFWGLDDERIQDLSCSATLNIPNQIMDRMRAAESVKDALDELAST